VCDRGMLRSTLLARRVTAFHQPCCVRSALAPQLRNAASRARPYAAPSLRGGKTAAAFGFLLFAVAACGSASSASGMRAAAADDWDCPESAIQVTNEGQNAFRVSGSGRTALYDCTDGSPSAPGGAPQSQPNAEKEYRFQGAGVACHKSSSD
jgi:hypothetical protein